MLKQNTTIFAQYPFRLMGGLGAERTMWDQTERRNKFVGEAGWSQQGGTPNGHLHPSSWSLPVKAGGISTYNGAVIALTTAGSLAAGVPISGSLSFGMDFAPASGQLITSGGGSASMVMSVSGNVLAVLNGVGSAGVSIGTNAPMLGALRWASGSGAFSITASMQSYAVGTMSGTTAGGELTPESIAAAILLAAQLAPIAADVRRVNTVTVQGNGQPGSEWGP